MTHTFNLTAKPYTSRVLGDWIAAREGGAARAGIQAYLPENSVTTNLNVDELAKMLGAMSQTASGVNVTPEIALRVSTVYACVSLIAGAISTLPFGVYERAEAASKEVAHDYWWMLNEQANSEWSACTAFEYLIASKFFYGDSFGRWIRASPYTNRVIGWEPLHPTRVQPFREQGTQKLYYRVSDQAGGIKVYDPIDMIHIPSLGFDGLRSPSPITYAAREAIGTSIAAESYSGKFFSQGSTHDIALKTDKKLDDDQKDSLRTSYMAKYGGMANNRMPLILTGGLTVEKLSITPNDAALLPTRQFSVEEICRIFGVPPFMVGATDKTTSWGTGIESQGIAFVKYTLRRHLTPIAQEFNRKLWPSRERFFVKHDVSPLERGDFKTRMEGYRVGVGRAGEQGWLTPNEVRHAEDLEPLTDGNKLQKPTAKPAPSTGEASDKSADSATEGKDDEETAAAAA